MISNEVVPGLSIDTFKNLVIVEDTDFDQSFLWTVEEAWSVINTLTRAVKKAEQYRK